MTLQEIFDKSAVHLLTQNAKSLTKKIRCTGDGEPGCAYRGDGGTMCAAGPFISDDVYSTDFEGGRVSREDVYKGLLRSGFPDSLAASDLLSRLQRVHDNLEPKDWAKTLVSIAQDRGLSTEAIHKWTIAGLEGKN